MKPPSTRTVAMIRDSRRGSCPPAALVVALLALAALTSNSPAATERGRLAPLQPWGRIVDDPATADSAWTGILALMPSLRDSAQRGFAWYLLASAAQARDRVDRMQVAVESSFVYRPGDASGLRDAAHYLSERRARLDLAESYAMRAIVSDRAANRPDAELVDTESLGYIQLLRGEDSAATATLERCVANPRYPKAWARYRLADLAAAHGQPARAIDHLVRGLAVFPQDSTEMGQETRRLDSLAATRGLALETLHRTIARDRALAKSNYYLGSHREGRAVPRAALVPLGPGTVEPPGRGLTVVYFWATWCGPCRHALPELQAWASAPRTRPVRVVTVNADGEALADMREPVRDFAAQIALRLPVLLADTTAAHAWRVRAFPTTFVVDGGRVVFRGYSGDLIAGLDAQLESLGSRRLAPYRER